MKLTDDIDICDVNQVAEYLKLIKETGEKIEVVPHIVETMTKIIKFAPFPEAGIVGWQYLSYCHGLLFATHPYVKNTILEWYAQLDGKAFGDKEKTELFKEFTYYGKGDDENKDDSKLDPNKFKLHAALNGIKPTPPKKLQSLNNPRNKFLY